MTYRRGEPLRTLAGHGSSGPKMLVLGGVFAGVGAARKLEDADVDVLVLMHDRFARAPADWIRAGFTHRRPGRITVRTHGNQEDLK